MSTQAQRKREADKLLKAARYWQNGSFACTHVTSEAISSIITALFDEAVDFANAAYIWASAALSEAARLSDTEMVDNESEE